MKRERTSPLFHNEKKSVIMMVASMLIFGTIGIFRRHIPLPSALIASSRGIMGGLFLLVCTGFGGKKTAERPAPGVLLRLVVTGALIGVNWILLFEAYNHTTVAIATLCYYMQPTIVILLSPFIFKEALTGKKAVCAVTAILGMILVSGVLGDRGSRSGDLRGVLLGLGAALFYSAVVIMNKRIQGIDARRRTTIQLLSAGITMIPYLVLTEGVSFEGMSGRVLILMLIVGIVHTGLAYLLYFGSMAGLGVQSIALLSYIDPVSALLFSALLLGEGLSVPGIIGAVMIIGSALISEMQTRKK